MKKAMFKPIEWLGDLGRKAHINVTAKYTAYVESCTPRERRIMMASATITFTAMFFATAAYADTKDDGLAGMFSKVTEQGESIKNNMAKFLAAAGLVCASKGGINWWKKGKEGDHSQIKGNQIFVPILAGAVMGATGYVMTKVGETVGIQSSAQGQLP
ncbi:DUF6750 family protein [Xylella fastidiosa]|uniref:DUF6750 family protein n=1 Tax=Xylella fastidiosa TaxID=2371 RepID=UPI000FEC5097|nr:DUF6750 family protein [Xylella fastidiosa]MRU28300.1 hypothetical protein [Xylella fastidiosa subsp. multiplex]MRU30690.1 hypothetical protein [Xylella fastidiosa subsp. multiplex]UIT53417.1 hypothetical protein LZ753_11625 [Xylella fastidiosa subsp. fastidiosa]WLE28523.1 hypothetical protein DVS74_011685 [Xylella fastidiosa subsp. multiplex]